jgi:hypothetical protein
MHETEEIERIDVLNKTLIAVVVCGALPLALSAQAEECVSREVNGTTFTNCVDGKPIQAHGVQANQMEADKQTGDKPQPPGSQRTFEFRPSNAADARPGMGGGKASGGPGR